MSIYKDVEVWDIKYVTYYLDRVSRYALQQAFSFGSCILVDPTLRNIHVDDISPRDEQWLEGLIRYEEQALKGLFKMPIPEIFVRGDALNPEIQLEGADRIGALIGAVPAIGD